MEIGQLPDLCGNPGAPLALLRRWMAGVPHEIVRDELSTALERVEKRIYDLRSTYATRLSAGGVADEWVTQLLRQGDAKVFKKYSQMKLQMKREALAKLNRKANDKKGSGTGEAA
jgi:hypothetical protein